VASTFKKMLKENKKLILWHILAWSLFAVYDNLNLVLFADNFSKAASLKNEILFSLFNVAGSVIIFYSLVYCLNFFLQAKKWVSTIGVIFLFGCSYFFNYIGSKFFIYLGLGDFPADEYHRIIFIGALQFFVPIFVFALAYVFGLSTIRKQREINNLQKNNILAERKNKNREIQNILLQNAFLRAQINPHFLYNTLNFFYAESLRYSEPLAEGILTLSQIMRYSLKQQEGSKDEKVLLSDEIEHIENVIKINRLRYKNNLFLHFEVEGNPRGVYIVPFVLITITENVFKHGEINNPDFPATIKIKVDKSSLSLYCFNKKKGGIKEPGTGIGMENTRQRLAYEYGEYFSLTSKDLDGFFRRTI
jgi:sensor histidine kinase YesM